MSCLCDYKFKLWSQSELVKTVTWSVQSVQLAHSQSFCCKSYIGTFWQRLGGEEIEVDSPFIYSQVQPFKLNMWSGNKFSKNCWEFYFIVEQKLRRSQQLPSEPVGIIRTYCAFGCCWCHGPYIFSFLHFLFKWMTVFYLLFSEFFRINKTSVEVIWLVYICLEKRLKHVM